jgi:hypothetical protein
MSSRRTLPRKAKSITAHTPSFLQHQLEQATDSPGGIHKIFTLIQHASNNDIETLNEHQWSPLVGAIFRLAKDTTRNGNGHTSEQELRKLIRLCHKRKLSLDSGAYFAAHYHRPLTIAAYFGFHSGVHQLLEFGALPDLPDGENKTAWHTAFDNPCRSAWGNALFRECDRRTARVLWDMGAVTSNLSDWKARNLDTRAGSVTYVNVESDLGSPLYLAIRNRRVDVVKFIVERGGAISDREFLVIYRRGNVKRLLLRMVDQLVDQVHDDMHTQQFADVPSQTLESNNHVMMSTILPGHFHQHGSQELNYPLRNGKAAVYLRICFSQK